MPGQADFPAVFARLKEILKVYQPSLVVKHDDELTRLTQTSVQRVQMENLV